ncbi:hypothetical protein BX600DRAFT_440054 [Xylariales sp. PMI_506]|nr:hypothetical protein BX600DRAFT_440054 [Xylariales sp. PMI_506]
MDLQNINQAKRTDLLQYSVLLFSQIPDHLAKLRKRRWKGCRLYAVQIPLRRKQELGEVKRKVDEFSQQLSQAEERARIAAQDAAASTNELSSKFESEKGELIGRIADLESRDFNEVKMATDSEEAKVMAQECAKKAEEEKDQATDLVRMKEQEFTKALGKAEEAKKAVTEAEARVREMERRKLSVEDHVRKLEDDHGARLPAHKSLTVGTGFLLES